MSMDVIDEVLSVLDTEKDDEAIEHTGTIIWNYYKNAGVQSKKGRAKNFTCIFCDSTFTGCSSSRAVAHILGRPVLGQKKTNVRSCVPIRKDDDNRYAQFKTAQKVLNKEMMSKEAQLSSSKAKQSVLDLSSPGKRTVTGEMKIVESKTLDSTIASFIYENAVIQCCRFTEFRSYGGSVYWIRSTKSRTQIQSTESTQNRRSTP